MKITSEFIYSIAPAAKKEYVTAIVKNYEMLERYGINSVDDTCHFLAQCAAETQGFNRLEESLYYTTTARLRAVWPSRFTSNSLASEYVRQPEKLANFVYGGRLGNTKPNDGWNFRGSGLPHLTGRLNFSGMAIRTSLPVVAQPDLVRAMPVALEAACDFWRANKLSRFVGNVVALTKAWQGADGALADRKTYTKRALDAAKAMNNTGAVIPTKDSNAIPTSYILRNGSSGSKVSSLQDALELRGYELGNIDGVFGDATERAVREFQSDNGLVSDGVVGPATMSALNAKAPVRKQTGLEAFIVWLTSIFGH